MTTKEPQEAVKLREIGILIVICLSARNLPDKHTFSKQDPYCICTLSNSTSGTTKVDKAGGQHPTWDAEFRMIVYENPTGGHQKLKVSVFAKELGEDDLLGEGEVVIDGRWPNNEFDDWISMSMNGKPKGEVFLEMTYYPAEVLPKSHVKTAATPVQLVASSLTRRPSKFTPAQRLARPLPIPQGSKLNQHQNSSRPSPNLPGAYPPSNSHIQATPHPLTIKQDSHIPHQQSHSTHLPFPGDPEPPAWLQPGRQAAAVPSSSIFPFQQQQPSYPVQQQHQYPQHQVQSQVSHPAQYYTNLAPEKGQTRWTGAPNAGYEARRFSPPSSKEPHFSHSAHLQSISPTPFPHQGPPMSPVINQYQYARPPPIPTPPPIQQYPSHQHQPSPQEVEDSVPAVPPRPHAAPMPGAYGSSESPSPPPPPRPPKTPLNTVPPRHSSYNSSHTNQTTNSVSPKPARTSSDQAYREAPLPTPPPPARSPIPAPSRIHAGQASLALRIKQEAEDARMAAKLAAVDDGADERKRRLERERLDEEMARKLTFEDGESDRKVEEARRAREEEDERLARELAERQD